MSPLSFQGICAYLKKQDTERPKKRNHIPNPFLFNIILYLGCIIRKVTPQKGAVEHLKRLRCFGLIYLFLLSFLSPTSFTTGCTSRVIFLTIFNYEI